MSVSLETPQDKDPPGSVTGHVTSDPDKYDPTALAGMLKLTSRLDASNNSINEADEVDDQSVLDFVDDLSMGKYDADEESDYDIDTGMDLHPDVDEVFEEIKETISRNLERKNSAVSNLSLSSSSSEGQVVKISDNFTSIPYGIQPRSTYEHGKKSPDIMGVSYNGRMRQFIILDAKGVITWKRDAVDTRVTQALTYPKYEYRLITHLVYARKHNCYFALAKDFSLKVMNRDFVETCSVSADLSSVLFMLFNPVRDELITGGVGGTKVWHFHQVAAKAFMELKPLANFRLTLRYELPNVGGSWVKRVDIDYNLDHLYCCSDTDLHAYDMQGKPLFKFSKAHSMSITGCQYSVASKVLVTASVDSEVKVWSLRGGLVHTFRGHSRAVTHLLIHPDTSTIAITSSLDGTVRMWSLDTMDALYSLVVSSDGVLWMGLTDDNLLYISTARNISIWSLNYFYQFWSLARNELSNLSLVGCKGKTTRIVALGEDSSLRLFARSNQKNMSTVLPPPSISPLQKVLSVCYSREFSVVFMLINPQEIWVYTTRTDPACRIAVWNIHEIQYVYIVNRSRNEQETGQGVRPSSSSSILHGGQTSHRATESGMGNEGIANCRCLCDLNASAMMWTDEGFCCPVRHSYLLLGMEDGRILFMDPVVKGQKYMEFKASKDPIEDMRHDPAHNSLITLCSLKELMQIQIWSLPDLALMHEVYCALDLAHYARINMTFLTGHKSGCVNDYNLTPAEDLGMYKAKAVPEFAEAVDIYKRPEHNDAIIALDACQTMKIFCSCSDEGAVKIWDEFRVLLTEITLDSSLSAACFLNDCGDMVVGFKKHMFYIDHTKVCPSLTPPETEPDTFDQESFVYEDPAVMYEGAMGNPDPITLANYLVPYELEFSKDFLEGKLQLDPMKTKKDEESEEESEFSMAPTEIYFSPPDTPKPLSTLDLTLGSDVSKYDLVTHMEKTIQILIERATAPVYRREKTPQERPPSSARSRDSAGKKKKHRRRKRTIVVSDEETDKEEKTREITPIEFPVFGSSPGPTPTPSTPSTPLSASGAEDSEGEGQAGDTSRPDAAPALTHEQKLQAEPKTTKAGKGKIVSRPVLMKEVKKEEVSAEDGLKFSPQATFSLSDMKVDIKSLLKEKRQKVKVKEADHSHVKSEQTETVREKEKPKRQIQKKKAPVTRKMPKRGQKSAVSALDKLPDVKDNQEKKEESPAQPRAEEIPQAPETKSSPEAEETVLRNEEEKPTVSEADPRPDHVPQVEISKPDRPSVPDVPSVPGLPSVPDLPSVPGLPLVPDLPSVPGLPERSQSRERLKSGKVRKNLSFLGEASLPLGDRSGEVTLDGLSDSEDRSVESGQVRQVISHGRAATILRIPSVSEETESILTRNLSPQFVPHPPDSTHQSDSYCGPPATPMTPDTSLGDGSFSPLPQPTMTPESVNVVLPEVIRDEDDLDIRSYMGESDSGMDSEFISVSQRGMYLTETEISEGEEEERVVMTGLLSDPGRISLKQRPASSFIDRPELEQDSRSSKARPHTAANDHFTTELEMIVDLPDSFNDLQAAFNAAMTKYQRIPGSSLSPARLHRNDGVSFDENWQDRAIERHMLLRIQKELRHYNAAQKRQLLEQRQRERQTSLFGHTDCGHNTVSAPRPGSSAYAVQQLERANTTMPLRSTTAASSLGPQRPRPQTAHFGALKHQQQKQTERNELAAETPFRLRMSPVPRPARTRAWSERKGTPESQKKIDPQLLDPRNPHAIRPKSSRSIPSKCSRYILVSRPKDQNQLPVPTPMEEQLLFERFPNIGMKTLNTFDGTIIRQRKPTYGIEYSPFAPQMH